MVGDSSDNIKGIKGIGKVRETSIVNSCSNFSEFLAKKLGYDSKNKSRIMSCLGALNFIDYEMNSPIKELSGGQKAKLYLLSLVLEEKNVLVLDEPTRNLSPLSLPTIITILKDFKGCIISVSHDRRYIKEVSSTIYKLTKAGLIKM